MSATESRRPHVVVLTLGGTIAMSRQEVGPAVVPTLTADDLVSGLPSVGDITLHAQTIVNRPGASLTVADLLIVLRAARDAVDDGALGVVVTQGTDTLEETAFLLDMLWDRRAPLIFTGAMRNPTQPGADGPANLVSAVVVAASPSCRDIGCLVVMNDEIHAARYVRKEHSGSPAAFSSPGTGALGSVKEGRVILRLLPPPCNWNVISPAGPLARVALIEATFDDGGELLDHCITNHFDGVVIAAFGAGHLAEAAAEAAIRLAASKPVVLASRCGAGGPLQRTYGFPGSETHLLANGLISSGELDARKARLLLLLLLSSHADRDAIAAAFAAPQGPSLVSD